MSGTLSVKESMWTGGGGGGGEGGMSVEESMWTLFYNVVPVLHIAVCLRFIMVILFAVLQVPVLCWCNLLSIIM